MINALFKYHLIALFISLVKYSMVYGQVDFISRKSNILLNLVDESVPMDFGAHGGEATPNIDRLTREGMMLTNMHASQVCYPLRSMWLTGSDNHLACVANLLEMISTEFLNEPDYGGVFNDRVQTIATRLKKIDLGEAKDIASQESALFQKMLAAHKDYEKEVGFIKMPEGYSVKEEVTKMAITQFLKNLFSILLVIVIILAGIGFWRSMKEKGK